MGASDGAGQDDNENLIKLLYIAVLGREVEAEALKARVAALVDGESFAEMFREVAMTEEARSRLLGGGQKLFSGGVPGHLVDMDEQERAPLVHHAIGVAYAHFLKRKPTLEDVTIWAGIISAGMSVERCLAEIARSDEARLKAGRLDVGAGLSDGEFLMEASDALFGRGLMPTETVAWQRRLETGDMTRAETISAIIDDRIRATSRSEAVASDYNSDVCSVLGTSRMLSRDHWKERAQELCFDQRPERKIIPLADRQFHHSGEYVVSMIASLYKGGAFIERFMENIVSQKLFNRSELIIVDADSPEREGDVIEAYREVYPNIVYRRINYRLGIYDAWNVGVEMSRGRYLTNTNLDDLRRQDSIALQSAVLDAEPDIDVVYQDFLYSFDPCLSFDEVEAFGFKSELPILTPNNLLLFNSPHNAPMWRRELHDHVGLFDTHYKSAGDYEFWVRCVDAGKTFKKINTPHVVYYQNPAGISTRPDTRGVEEAQDVLRRYGHKLTRSALLQSRRDLHAGLGLEDEQRDGDVGKSYYEVVQEALVDLGRNRTPKLTTSSQERREAVESVKEHR